MTGDIWVNVTPCAAHEHEAQPGCEWCEAEMDQRGEVLQDLSAEVQQRITSLANMGKHFPPQAIEHIRLETLIEMILRDRNLFLFEGAAGQRIVESLREMQTDALREEIAGPQRSLSVVRNGTGRRPIKDNPQA